MSGRCGAEESDLLGTRTCHLDPHVFGRHRSEDGREWRDSPINAVTVGRAELLALANRLRQTDSFNAQSVAAAVALNLDKMAGESTSRSSPVAVIDSVTPMIVGGILGALLGPAIIAGSKELLRMEAKRKADECEAAKTAPKKRTGKIVKGKPKKRKHAGSPIHGPPANRRKARP